MLPSAFSPFRVVEEYAMTAAARSAGAARIERQPRSIEFCECYVS